MKKYCAWLMPVLSLAFPNILWAMGPTKISGDLTSNTVWEESNSPYFIEGSVRVAKGAVLTVRPGVQVRFMAGQAGYGGGLIVQGGLVAEGGPGRPIFFSPAPGVNVWGGICFISSDPNQSLLRRCVVVSGRLAISESSPLIDQCALYGASCAIEVGPNSNPKITSNRITANRVGLLLSGTGSNPWVAKNVFYNNDIAVYAREFGNPSITGNILYGNKNYNFVNRSPKAFSAPWNDFRTADTGVITQTLWDAQRDPQAGPINYRPFMPPVENHEAVLVSAEKVFQPRLALTLDGSLAKGQGQNVPASMSVGLGNMLRVEYQFRSFLSLGLAFGYSAYTGNGQVGTAGSLDLIGRVVPFSGGGFDHYLIGGAGINPLYNAKTTPWIGRWHAMAGLGTRYALDNNWGLDLSAVYNFYTPMAKHVDAFTVKVGVGYAFGL